MLYRITATIEDGLPQLQILDATGDCLRLAWQPTRLQESRQAEGRQNELQDFFRELLLITTMDEILENSHHPGKPEINQRQKPS